MLNTKTITKTLCLSFLLSLFVLTNAAAIHKRDSSDIISPAYGATVTQYSTITVDTHRWGMSLWSSGNYTVQSENGTVIYGPVVLDFGTNVVNMSNIGVGSYNIVLVQAQYVMEYSNLYNRNDRQLTYSTTIHPFTVVASLPTNTDNAPNASDSPSSTTPSSTTTTPEVTIAASETPLSTDFTDSDVPASTSSTSGSGRNFSPSRTGIYISLMAGVMVLFM